MVILPDGTQSIHNIDVCTVYNNFKNHWRDAKFFFTKATMTFLNHFKYLRMYKYVTRFYKTVPNHTQAKLKLAPPVGSYTIVLLVLTLSTTQTT